MATTILLLVTTLALVTKPEFQPVLLTMLLHVVIGANMLVTGSTGSAKSSYVRHLLRKIIKKCPDAAFVFLDGQHRKSGWRFFKDCVALGQLHRTVFEVLSHTDRVIQWLFLQQSAKEGWDIETEDKLEVEIHHDALSRVRGLENLGMNFLTKQWSDPGALFYMYQDPRKSFREMKRALRPNTDEWEQWCDECKHAEAAQTFREMPTSRFSWERELGPMIRLYDILFHSAPVHIRTALNKGWDFYSFLDNGGIYIVDGGDIADEDKNFLLASIGLRVFRYYQHGKRKKIFLILEEAEAFNLVKLHEAKALKSLRDYGLIIIIICQSPYFLNDKTTEDIWQNTGTHIICKCDSFSIATKCAEDLLTHTDPDRIHHTDERERQLNDGFDTVMTHAESYRDDGTLTDSTGQHFLAKHRGVIDETNHYMALREQILDWARRIMGLKPGQYFAKTPSDLPVDADEEPTPMSFEEPKDLIGDDEAWAAHEQMKQKPPFVDPPKPTEKSETHSSTGWSTTTRSRTNKSSKPKSDSRPRKRSAGESGNSKKDKGQDDSDVLDMFS